MIRKRTKTGIEVVPTHGHDYHGNPHDWLTFQWYTDKTKHTGRMFLEDLVGPCLGFEVKPGDRLRITVEVNPEESQ